MFSSKDNWYPLSVPVPKAGARAPGFNQGKVSRFQKANHQSRQRDKFTGLEEVLEDHTYTLGYLRAEYFATTRKAISSYVRKTYKNGGNVKRSIDPLYVIDIPQPSNLKTATPKAPADPGDPTVTPPISPTPSILVTPGPTQTEERIWQKEVDEFMRRRQILVRNLENLFALLWGQCEKPLQEKLRSIPQYEELAANCDALALLLTIREVAFNQQSHRYQPLQVLEMNKWLLRTQQRRYHTWSSSVTKSSK